MEPPDKVCRDHITTCLPQPWSDARLRHRAGLSASPRFRAAPAAGLTQRFKDVEAEVYNALLTLINDTKVREGGRCSYQPKLNQVKLAERGGGGGWRWRLEVGGSGGGVWRWEVEMGVRGGGGGCGDGGALGCDVWERAGRRRSGCHRHHASPPPPW